MLYCFEERACVRVDRLGVGSDLPLWYRFSVELIDGIGYLKYLSLL
jgi:hypothetical protein